MELQHFQTIDSTIYDQFINPSITGNVFNDYIHYLQKEENNIVVYVPDKYKYRPERIANLYYGSEQYYPLILLANNIGTLFQFIPSNMNNQVKLLKPEILQKLLNK